MDCHRHRAPDGAEFLRDFGRRLFARRVPVSASLEFTRRCNLRCVHCYLREEPLPDGEAELDTGQWREVIDQITREGCLNLLLTGGEPLLRRDFAEIYRHARRRGLLVTVFTNATLVTAETVALFREFPPQKVEITLYGATRGVYEEVTGVPGSHRRCLDGFRRLLRGGVRTALKTMVLTTNQHQVEAMREFARRAGVGFRLDAALFPTLSGERRPLAFRVPADLAVERELADGALRDSWRAYGERMGGAAPPDGLYHCGAGVTDFHLDAAGRLLPCLMSTRAAGLVREEGSFARLWREEMPRLREQKAERDIVQCNRCPARAFCGFCPAFFRLESGDETVRSDYLCRQAHLRREMVTRQSPG
jgi:radical SAM protein with 4Fe4S-binding SPASM domain